MAENEGFSESLGFRFYIERTQVLNWHLSACVEQESHIHQHPRR